MESEKDYLINNLVGLKLEEGRAICNFFYIRAIVTNGIPTFTGPSDYIPERVNVSVLDGVIKSIICFG